MTLCEKCIHEKVCAERDCYDEADERALTFCSDHKPKSRFVELPCEVGSAVYVVNYCRCGKPEAYEMKHCHKKNTVKTPKVLASVMLRQEGKRLKRGSNWFEPPQFEWRPIGTICYKVIQKPFELKMLTEYGKTVFLSREEAEKALKERERE